MNNKKALPSYFTHLLPDFVVVVQANSSMWQHGLLPEEQALIETAVEKRKREFTAGRNCARTALVSLGLKPSPILMGERREPIFPDNIVGSITHCKDYCAAVLTYKHNCRALGIDAEENTPLEQDIEPLILSSREREHIKELGQSFFNIPHLNKLVFSIKESFYKAYSSITGQFLDFLEAEVVLSPEDRIFTIKPIIQTHHDLFDHTLHKGRYCWDQERVYTAICIV